MSKSASRLRLRVWSLILFMVSVVAGATLPVTSATSAVAASSDNTNAADAWLASTEYDFSSVSTVSEAVSYSTEAVVVRVDSIDPPFFNSVTGGPWEGDDQTPANVFSWVHATVTSTWQGPSLSGSIDLLVLGNPSQRYEGGQDLPPFALVSGGFTPGSSYVLLLKKFSFGFQGEESITAWTLAGEFETNWELSDSKAVSGDANLSMSADDLNKALASAWPKSAGTRLST